MSDHLTTLLEAFTITATAELNAIRRYLLELKILDSEKLRGYFHEELDLLLERMESESPEGDTSTSLLRRLIKSTMAAASDSIDADDSSST